MKGYFKNMKTITKVDFATYLGVILAFIVVSICQAQGLVSRSLGGMLVPICCYVCMSISLNLTVGILGELSLGHAGFMSVGAFSGIIAAMSLQSAVPNDLVRMIVALVVGAFFAAIVGFIVGIPVLRLRGDYLAIVTLAFGEIIKDLINCLLVGWDENGLHIALNVDGTKSMSSLGLSENGIEIIKGAQGATGNARIATFAMGFALVMITLVVVLNLVRSRTHGHPGQPDRRRERRHQRHQVQADCLRHLRLPGRCRRCPVRPELLQCHCRTVRLQHLHSGAGVCGTGRSGQHLGLHRGNSCPVCAAGGPAAVL